MIQMFVEKEVKVLLAMMDQSAVQKLTDFLAAEGVFVRACQKDGDLKEFLATWQPQFIIIDLMYTEMGALTLLKTLRQNDKTLRNIPRVFVTSQFHNNPQNVKECLRWGAADYLISPLKHGDVLARIILHTQEKRELKDMSSTEDLQSMSEGQYYIHLVDLTLKEAMKSPKMEVSLHNLSKMAEMAMKAARVSIIECDLDNRVGLVHGSSDNRHVRQLKLDLNKYPEIIYTLHSGKLLAIDNLEKDPTMKAIGEQSKSIDFSSIIVVPIEHKKGFWGVLSVRTKTRRPFKDIELQFVQFISHVITLTIQKNETALSAQKAS